MYIFAAGVAVGAGVAGAAVAVGAVVAFGAVVEPVAAGFVVPHALNKDAAMSMKITRNDDLLTFISISPNH
jgi:hypothetical protein